MNNKIYIRDLSYSELEQHLVDMGEAKYRAKQIQLWLNKGVDNFNDMKNISSELKLKLEKSFVLSHMNIDLVQKANDGTMKYLLRLYDDDIIEAVFMSYSHGHSLCISTQVGCKMGCNFCASTIGGKVRDLSSGEMIEQITKIQNDTGKRVSNVVLMGIGEPLDNFENVVKFIKQVSSLENLNIGQRHITVSTCGIVDKIDELASYNFQITLAISLHSPFDYERDKMMPINKKDNIHSVLSAAKRYFNKTKRRLTFEYALIKDENDSKDHAEKLSMLLNNLNCHVNLIPLNDVFENNYKKSDAKTVNIFKKILDKNNINVTVRRELGQDIDAACGQLRKKRKDNF